MEPSFPPPPPPFVVLPPTSSCLPSQLSEWTWHENKLFENAIAEFNLKGLDLFEKIASRVPGKTIEQIAKHYKALVDDIANIESSNYPILKYVDDKKINENSEEQIAKWSTLEKSLAVPSQKKGVFWTEEEHRLFLMGLEKYGKGDWRSISRYFVKTRSSTQVASHAQKYFIRLNNQGPKGKRPSSVLDIQTVNSMPKPIMPTSTNPKPIIPKVKFTMPTSSKCKPIAPSPFPPSPPIVPPPVDYYPMEGSMVHSKFGSSTMPSTTSSTTVDAPSLSEPALYDFDEACMNDLLNSLNSDFPLDDLMSDPHPDSYSLYPPDLAKDSP